VENAEIAGRMRMSHNWIDRITLTDGTSQSRIDEHNRHKTRYDVPPHPTKHKRNERVVFAGFLYPSVSFLRS
jgi:hypothetical protein